MTLTEFRDQLAAHAGLPVRFTLPDGTSVPAHAHVTEVARVDKHFVDCGGTRREEHHCRLQVWVAHDVAHRLTAGKLVKILGHAAPLLPDADVPVDVEYEAGYIAQFPLESVGAAGGELRLQLGVRHTACLAEDRCGITPPAAPALGIHFRPRTETAPARCC